MKTCGLLLVAAACCSTAGAGVRSGKAEAEWISASSTYEPGKPVQMAIRLVIDPGWHSYWLNPGNAELVMSLDEGASIETPSAKLIGEALAQVPRVRQEWGPLEVLENNGVISLRITASGLLQQGLTILDAFPATPGMIHSNHKIEFTRHGNGWNAEVQKSEDAPTQVRELALVVVPESGHPPILLDWKIR